MPITVETKTKDLRGPLAAMVRRVLQRTAFATAMDVKASIIDAAGPSAPETPPHTHGGKMRQAVAYDVSDDDAIVGFKASFVGDVGHADEFGGEFRDQRYPKRPSLLPALERNEDEFVANFGGALTTPFGD